MNSSKLEERILSFKAKLLERTKVCHDQFLNENLADANIIDPFTSKMWHHTFNPHSVASIPLADLKQQP